MSLIGYSWGGGAVFDLAAQLTNAGIGRIAFTGYVDALARPANPIDPAETRRPANSRLHYNFYQTTAKLPARSHGAPTMALGFPTVNVNVTSRLLDHYNIDDHQGVQSQLRAALEKAMAR